MEQNDLLRFQISSHNLFWNRAFEEERERDMTERRFTKKNSTEKLEMYRPPRLLAGEKEEARERSHNFCARNSH
jgi:hypothetical protein